MPAVSFCKDKATLAMNKRCVLLFSPLCNTASCFLTYLLCSAMIDKTNRKSSGSQPFSAYIASPRLRTTPPNPHCLYGSKKHCAHSALRRAFAISGSVCLSVLPGHLLEFKIVHKLWTIWVTRQWCQFLFMQRCEEDFAMARASGDANAFAKVLSALGKFTRLDHDEAIGPDYSQIVPQQFELTTDPAVAGFERIPNVQVRVRLLFKRFKKEAEEADAVEVVQPQEPQEPSTHAAAHPSY